MTKLLSITCIVLYSYLGCSNNSGWSQSVENTGFNFPDDTVSLPPVPEIPLSLDEFTQLDSEFKWSLPLPASAFSGGSIALGYEYGFPSDMNPYRSSVGTYYIKGKAEVQPLGVPVLIEGNYYQYSVRPETQNYFRVSFDKNSFKEQVKAKQKACLSSIDSKRESLTQMKGFSKADLGAYSYSLGQTGFELPGSGYYNGTENYDDLLQNPLSNMELPGTSLPDLELNPDVHLNLNAPPDSVQLPDSLSQDISGLSNEAKLKQDSLINGVMLAKSRLDSIDQTISSLNKYQSIVKDGGSTYTKGLKDKLQHIQKFQLGQTNPFFSTFMLSGVPVNGVTVQYESKTREFNFTHGQVITPMWAPLTQRQDVVRNILGDVIPAWNNIGDRITSGTWAITKTEDLEVHFGGLYGLDKFRDLGTAPLEGGYTYPARSGVGEVSGLWKLNPDHEFKWAYARSEYFESNGASEVSTNADKASSGGNAFQLGWNGSFVKTNTQVKLEWSRIEPLFRSLGNPFLRDDMSKLTGSISQKFKRLNLGISGRGQRNNLLRNADFTTRLYQVNYMAQFKISRSLSGSLNYVPVRVIQQNHIELTQDRMLMDQWIGNLVYVKQIRDVSATLIASASRFDLRTSTGSSHSDDWSLSLNTDNGKGLVLSTTWLLVRSNSEDTLWSGTSWSLTEEATYSFKNFRVHGGLTYLEDSSNSDQFGYQIGVEAIVRNRVQMELKGEKIAMASYYSDILLDLYRQFPYTITCSVRYTF